MSSLEHWQQIWASRQASDVSWYEPAASTSLNQILASGVGRERPVIDVGGGASTLVDGLLDAGFDDITVIDVAEEGMAQARHRLGAAAAAVHWQRADVTELALGRRFSLWHDRAVFHFLTGARERVAYKAALLSHLADDGQVVL
ncbi:MAG: trans-aconitate methyltransferase, partial [Myxococcota bacterium]